MEKEKNVKEELKEKELTKEKIQSPELPQAMDSILDILDCINQE